MHTRFRHLRAILRDAPTDSGTPTPSGGGAPAGAGSETSPAGSAAPPFDPSSLPPEVQEYIRKREKAADEKARTTTRDNAAAAAEQKVRDEMAKALGLKPEQVDPAQTAAALKAAQDANTTLRIEVTVERIARKAGADEDLVAAKLQRDGKLKGLDPEAEGFEAKVRELVDAAIAANPRLKLDTTTPPPPAAQGGVGSHSAPAGGEGGTVRPKSLSEALSKIKL